MRKIGFSNLRKKKKCGSGDLNPGHNVSTVFSIGNVVYWSNFLSSLTTILLPQKKIINGPTRIRTGDPHLSNLFACKASLRFAPEGKQTAFSQVFCVSKKAVRVMS